MALSHFMDKHSIECRLVNLPKARGKFVSAPWGLRSCAVLERRVDLEPVEVVNSNLLLQIYAWFLQLKNVLCILIMSPKEHLSFREEEPYD